MRPSSGTLAFAGRAAAGRARKAADVAVEPERTADCPATDMRANMWACFREGVGTYFYWHANYWNGVEGSNVWSGALTYTEEGVRAAGDGVLVYPGEYADCPEEDRGVAGPISGISMANLRRGVQDHLYLAMARNAGLDVLVDELLDRIIPYAFADTPSGGVVFPENANEYEEARRALAQALELTESQR